MDKGYALLCIGLIALGVNGATRLYLQHESILWVIGCGVPVLMGTFGILQKCE